MTDQGVSPGDLVAAVLEGGPTDLPAAARTGRVPAGDRKVKVVHRGGYEHFERMDGDPVPGPAPEAGPVVFRWKTRTKMAE